MLAKESVQVRLERGLSFTEFSYMLLQAYDFAHLHRELGVELQMGGADQWGNITAGLELIRRTSGAGEGSHPAHGLAYNLLLSPSGTKFGKSDTGDSVWLDPQRTTPYAFYQYWLNTDDRDVGTYLRWFTELGRAEIEALEAEARARPDARAAQRALARDITARAHGEAAATEAIRDSEAMFSGGPIEDPEVLRSLFESTGGFTFDPCDAGGRCGRVPGRRRCLRLARRGAPFHRGRRRDDQRDAGVGPGARSGAHRRGVARGPDRQAPPGDRSPGGLTGELGAVALGGRAGRRRADPELAAVAAARGCRGSALPPSSARVATAHRLADNRQGGIPAARADACWRVTGRTRSGASRAFRPPVRSHPVVEVPVGAVGAHSPGLPAAEPCRDVGPVQPRHRWRLWLSRVACSEACR